MDATAVGVPNGLGELRPGYRVFRCTEVFPQKGHMFFSESFWRA